MRTHSIIRQPQSKCLKCVRVALAPGEEVGEHVTEKREEVIIVLKGSGTLVKSGERIALAEGSAYFIPEGTKHNVKNDSLSSLEYVYVVAPLACMQ